MIVGRRRCNCKLVEMEVLQYFKIIVFYESGVYYAEVAESADAANGVAHVGVNGGDESSSEAPPT